MGLLTSVRFSQISGESSESHAWLWTSATLLLPVAVCVMQRLARQTSSKTSLMTDDWAHTSSIFELLPRWRLHLSVITRWLPGYLLGSGALDPTNGKLRSYWSYKADAYEQMAPKFTLAHIARWFGVEAWKGRIHAKLHEASNHPGANGGDSLRATIEKLMTAEACSSGNSVRLPANGPQAFEWRRRLIRGAKKRLLFMSAYMSVDDDARAVASDLAECTKRGVECYIALDNFGADAFAWCGPDTRYKKQGQEQFQYADLIRMFRDSGAKLCFWRAADCARARGAASGASSEYELFDCKNHIKMIIADGEVALLTDRNMGSAYFRNPAYSSTEVVLAGPCVEELEKQFSKLWQAGGGLQPLSASSKSEGSALGGSKLFDSLCDSPDDDKVRLFRNVWGAVMVSTPRELESGVDPILLAAMLGIRAAKHSVDFMFAYMEICKPLREELVAALSRGVSVRVVTNSRETNDLFWINGAFLQSVLPVVEAGGKLVMSVCTEKAKGHVHAKVAVIDGRYLLVGSWNAWLRSTLYEVEADVLLDSPSLASLTSSAIDDLEVSDAYRTYDPQQIRAEFAADPLGVDPAVVGFL